MKNHFANLYDILLSRSRVLLKMYKSMFCSKSDEFRFELLYIIWEVLLGVAETDLTVPSVPNRGFGTSTHFSKAACHILMKLSSYL